MDTGNPGYFNRYSYTFNDPINLIDPSGMAVSCSGGQSGSTTCSDTVSGDSFTSENASSNDIGRLNGLVEPSDVASVVDSAIGRSSSRELSSADKIQNNQSGEASGGRAGNSVDGNQRYVMTENGWVDLKHVVSAGALPNNPITATGLGLGLEGKQLVTEPNSAFAGEDLRSNAIGISARSDVGAFRQSNGKPYTLGQAVSGQIGLDTGIQGAMTGAQALTSLGFKRVE